MPDSARLAMPHEQRANEVTAVLARAPSDGGKTRLVASLPATEARDLRNAILLDTLDTARDAPGDLAVIFTPAGAHREISGLAGDARVLIAQRGGDIGQRMAAAFEDLAVLGYARMILIGSDLPTLPARFLRDAHAALRRQTVDVVLGPADDGGYYLVGLEALQPVLFEAIDWSTPHVLQQTLTRARQVRLRVHMLPGWYDVDTPLALDRAAHDAPGGRTAQCWRQMRPV